MRRYQALRTRQSDEKARLKVQEIKTEDHLQTESRIWLRIARAKGIDVTQVIGEEYKPLKALVEDELKQKFLD